MTNSLSDDGFGLISWLQFDQLSKIMYNRRNSGVLTISRAASNQMSSLFGHSSHPFMIRFLAACSLPVTSSRRAEAIQAGGCLGFVSLTDFKSSLAFLTSLKKFKLF
jgi:hypothetical protein